MLDHVKLNRQIACYCQLRKPIRLASLLEKRSSTTSSGYFDRRLLDVQQFSASFIFTQHFSSQHTYPFDTWNTVDEPEIILAL